MNKKQEILDAKKHLYSLLLKLDNEEITDNELDIMMFLCKDEQIQELFNQTKNK